MKFNVRDQGNATYAAITAVVAANLVLVAYIVTSLLEDSQPDAPSRPDETKKGR
jgi:VMA21-like domain.